MGVSVFAGLIVFFGYPLINKLSSPVRDVLVMEVPTVLRTELYAVAALLGAALMVGGQSFGMPVHVAAPAGAVLCITLRLLALHYGWHLPVARQIT